MDIYIGNVVPNANYIALRFFLKEHLKALGITGFLVQKSKNQNHAFLTVSTEAKGSALLQRYGFVAGAARHGSSREPLKFRGRDLKFSRGSRRPDALLITVLQDEEAQRSAETTHHAKGLHNEPLLPTLPFASLSTGVWEYNRQGALVFDRKRQDHRSGYITFGRKDLVIYLEATRTPQESNWSCRIDIVYAVVEHVVLSNSKGRGSMTLTLRAPPKMYHVQTTDDLEHYTGQAAYVDIYHNLAVALERASLTPQSKAQPLERITSLQHSSNLNAGLCMVYMITFPDVYTARFAQKHVSRVHSLKKHYHESMGSLDRPLSTIENDFARVQRAIESQERYLPEPSFGLRYQLEALLREGTLTPLNLIMLVPGIYQLARDHGVELTARAMRHVYHFIETPSPDISAQEFKPQALIKIMKDILTDERQDWTSSYISTKGHLALTYRVMITPTGLLLRGPDYDISNRVLRKYADYADHFIRVSFADENGMPIRYDKRADQEAVYSRFRSVLSEGVEVAGRRFEFLGFSHSSLRLHQVWCMSPFFKDKVLLRAQDIRSQLGHFKEFRCSAKCAARIGQAFSDTIFAITLPKTAVVSRVEDIQKGNRCFSDGCGTISLDLLQYVWRHLPRQQKPTTLQIRFQGAKGIVSLDKTLLGQRMNLANSMIKFETTPDMRDVEICEASYRPLKAFLNHQFIKILEDLGVPAKRFLEVQEDAVKELELMLHSPLNTASFLEASQSGSAAKIPDLITMLDHIGVSFYTDRFLTDLVEIAAMTSLRDLKYRARIPVVNGYLLFGLVDEWNVLREGEVYIHVDDPGETGYKHRGPIVRDRILITRAPALHPGDVQLVKAVNVAENLPLAALRNCIVFSQQGIRDLPSQLSGGDLDGDKYHIFFDERIIPEVTVPAAEYPRIAPKDLGRAVETSDIVDHFLDFMQSDQLGQISTKHKIRADKMPNGTHDADCKKLAGLASTAVDFSKTGNAVKMSEVPQGKDWIRPDFMAPSQQLVLDQGTVSLEALESAASDPDDDPLIVLNSEQPSYRYYRSSKALGILFRAIDERLFLNTMKDNFSEHRKTWGDYNIMHKLERYIDRETTGIQWQHHRGFADELLHTYELNLQEIMDTMRLHRSEPLTELEVVSGNILGKKEQRESRHTREANIELRAAFRREVDSTIMSILNGHDEFDEDDSDLEALPRSIACFKEAVKHTARDMQSWKYITVSVCLKRLWIHNRSLGMNRLRKF